MSDVRGVWVDEGNDADLPKIRGVGGQPWYATRDPRVTANYLANVAGEGTSPGLYIVSSWTPTLTGPQFAEHADAELRRIGWKGNPPICFDVETKDIAGFVVPCFQRWRQLRPTRATWWTLEGMQGGLFDSTTPLTLCSTLGVRVAPQLYRGDMSPLPHSPVIDLLLAGFPGTMIDGCYDAAALPYRWRGFAFTMGRLP